MTALSDPRPALDVTWSASLSPEESAIYDAFVDAAAGGHIAQTRAWGDVTMASQVCALRYAIVREEAHGGRVVGTAALRRPRAIGPIVAPVAVVERGPVCANPGDVGRVLEALTAVARRHGVARLEVMPYWAGDDAAVAEAGLAAAGFRSVQELDGAHAVTLRLDIDGKPDTDILAGKERESLRRKLRQAEKAGAKVRRGGREDMAILEQLYASLMDPQGKRGKPRAYFDALWNEVVADGERGAVFVCEHEGEVIAALFVSRHGPVACFVLGATSSAPRNFSKMALPMMEAVRWARDNGCRVFDMGGIPMDGDTDEKRASIAQFKFDFAKTRVPLVRAHARWF